MIYFHYCKDYIENVLPQADKLIRKKLEEFSNRENLKGINTISSYTGKICVLQLKNPHTKIILQEQRMPLYGEDFVVYFVREAISMGQDHYWLENYVQIRDGKWLEYNPLPNEEIELEKFREELFQFNDRFINKTTPPYELTKWHHDYELRVEYDIYETEDWVKFAMSNSETDGMADHTDLYRLVLLELLKGEACRAEIEILKTNVNESIEFAVYNDTAVIYNKIKLNTEKEVIYLLYNGGIINSQADHLNNSKALISKSEKQFKNIEDIQRFALRAYPKWAIDNMALWKEIEKNSETGNLSLLPEQTNFLKNFKFPSYINGQAGSGKSTMLYYLFANAYFYKCLGQIDGDIIFLTENENLLKHTKKSIIELLQCNTDFELTLEDISNVDKHFSSFKMFLLNMLPEEVKDFPLDKYLDFSKFKALYESSHLPIHIKNRYTSELVWFAITTYIYGYDLNFQMTSENYDDLMPKEGRELLSKEVLKGIEKEVLNPFYKKLIDNEGYWDKLKIIRYIRENVGITNHYEIVFCDEAQDFSRVELRFILDLSKYIQYDLSHTEQVPIVFAGDALQTVNPTGFRAAEVKDMLYEQLKEIAGFDLKNNMEYAPDFNYRSSQSIVNVANAVQFYRKAKFDAKIKKPQIAKRPELHKDYHLNVFIDFDTVNKDEELRKRLEYKTFIVPTNVEEKDEYIKLHPILNGFANVKTAVEAKGIDYEQVVIFGFGEFAEKNNTAEEYETRFFYNKLYVAVTRAQSELVIIDAKESENTFWRPMINAYAESEWAKHSGVTEKEIVETICYEANQIPNIKESTPEIALENAFKDMKQGEFDENPGLLRVAASQFLKLGKKKESFICAGLMYEYQEKWKEAAINYLKKEVGVEGFEKAANVYWKGKLLSELKSLDGNVKNETQEVRLLIVKLFQNEPLVFSDLKQLYTRRIELRKIFLETAWHEEIIDKLIAHFDNVTDEEQMKYLIDIFEEIASINELKLWKLIGEKHFYLRRYDRAIESFDKINYEGELFIKSKIEISRRSEAFSDCIFWLGRLIKETSVEKLKSNIEQEILSLYALNKSEISRVNNQYTYLYVYGAFLIRKPIDTSLIEIAQLVEKTFENKNELADYYKFLLESNRLQSTIINYVVDRWVKNKYQVSNDLNVINDEYKKIASLNKIKFQLFSVKDINEISLLPTVILPPPPSHFETLVIKNFRRFKDVRVENLGLFNLVVGDNNIGKTSFLEALLFTPNKKIYLERLAFAYIERKNIQPDKEDKSDMKRIYYNLDEHFLNDYKNSEDSLLNFEFIIEKSRASWRYKAQVKNDENILDNGYNNIIFDKNDFKYIADLSFLDSIKQPFMPYGKGFGIDLAQVYFDEIASKPKVENDFIKNLEFFISGILRVIVDTKRGSIELIDKEFPDEARPLHQYGEGVNKLFRIMLLLALHKGKLVLIDEVDAGIYHNRFKQFWKIILEIAKKDNTQIIATTHNDECIKYFTEELKDLGESFQKDSRVVQLKKVNDVTKIRSYEYDSFNLALIDGLEIRGGE